MWADTQPPYITTLLTVAIVALWKLVERLIAQVVARNKPEVHQNGWHEKVINLERELKYLRDWRHAMDEDNWKSRLDLVWQDFLDRKPK